MTEENHTMHCSTISSCRSAEISETVKRCCFWVLCPHLGKHSKTSQLEIFSVVLCNKTSTQEQQQHTDALQKKCLSLSNTALWPWPWPSFSQCQRHIGLHFDANFCCCCTSLQVKPAHFRSCCMVSIQFFLGIPGFHLVEFASFGSVPSSISIMCLSCLHLFAKMIMSNLSSVVCCMTSSFQSPVLICKSDTVHDAVWQSFDVMSVFPQTFHAFCSQWFKTHVMSKYSIHKPKHQAS